MFVKKSYLNKIIMEELDKQITQNKIDDLSKQMMDMLNNNMSTIKLAGQQGIQKANKNKQEVVDPISLTLIYSGIIAAIPAILKTIGWVQKKRGKLESAKQFSEWHNKWHGAWIETIKKTLSIATLGKFNKLDPEKQKKIAERFYLVIVAYLFGETAISLISHFNWLAPIEAILGAIKGGELVAALTNYIQSLK